MGWPRSNEGARVYREKKKDGDYILMFPEQRSAMGNYDAVVPVVAGTISLASSGVSPSFIHTKCQRVSWDEVPIDWQTEFRKWLTDKPGTIKGFWHSGKMPSKYSMDIQATTVAYHRNGVSGEGFHVVRFLFDHGGGQEAFIGVVFDDPGNVAVLQVDHITKGRIGQVTPRSPVGDCWRGDLFEGELRRAIAQWRKDQK